MVKVTGNLNLQNRFFGRFRSIHDQNDARIHFTSGNTSHLQYLSVCLSVCLSHTSHTSVLSSIAKIA